MKQESLTADLKPWNGMKEVSVKEFYEVVNPLDVVVMAVSESHSKFGGYCVFKTRMDRPVGYAYEYDACGKATKYALNA